MDRGGGHAAGSSSQGRSAWNTPLHPKPQAALSTKMAMKSPALSFNSQVKNPPYSSSEDESESGGEGGDVQAGRNVDALESSIMADYPITEDMDATGTTAALL